MVLEFRDPENQGLLCKSSAVMVLKACCSVNTNENTNAILSISTPFLCISSLYLV